MSYHDDIKTNSAPKIDRMQMIDAIAHDPKTDEAVLVMNEPAEWSGSDEELHHLQERFNVYASFLLDGELVEAHPELASKKARIEVRCAHMPDARALELLGMIHDQLEFQEVRVEVVVSENCSGGL
jgi:hypothetical protein